MMRAASVAAFLFVWASGDSFAEDGLWSSDTPDSLPGIDVLRPFSDGIEVHDRDERLLRRFDFAPDGMELYLASLEYKRKTLAQLLEIYQIEGGATLVMLDGFLETLEFRMERRAGYRKVWFGGSGPDETIFELDLNGDEPSLKIDSEAVRLRVGDVYLIEGDIYIRQALLTRWFGLQSDFDRYAQSLTINSDYQLPFERRAERHDMQQRLRQGRMDATLDKVMDVPNRYKLATIPALDIVSTTNVAPKTGGVGVSQSINVTGAFDLLHNSVFYNANVSKAAGTGVKGQQRLTVSRRSRLPNSEIVPGINFYSLGDVYQLANPTLVSGGAGLGVVLGKEDYLNEANSETTDIVGDGPPGWEVELYRDNVLLDFGSVGADGRYVFDDVVLLFGANRFEVKLYSPEGEIRTQSVDFWGGGKALTKGEVSYRVSFMDHTRNVFERIPNPDQLKVRKTIAGQVDVAITNRMQTGVAFVHTEVENRGAEGVFMWESFLQGRLRYDFNVATMRALFTSQLGGGNAQRISLTGGLFGQSVNLTYAHFDDDFESPETRDDVKDRHRGSIGVSGKINWSWLNFYQFENRFARDINRNNELTTRLTLGGRLFSKTYWNNRLERTDRSAGKAQYQGLFRLTNSVGRWRIRNEVDYQFGSGKVFRNVSTLVGYNFSSRWYTQFTLTHSLASKYRAFMRNELTYKGDKLGITLSTSGDTDGGWSVSLRLTSSIFFRNKKPKFSSVPMSQMARAKLTFFLDENGNEKMEPDEERLEGVVIANRSRKDASDENGEMILSSLSPSSPFFLRGEHVSLGDPFLAMSRPATRVFLHPGSVAEVAIPANAVGIVEGTVLRTVGGERKPYVGLSIALVLDGEVIDETLTQFDGYYSFEGVQTFKDFKIKAVDQRYSGKEVEVPVRLEVEDFFVMDDIVF